MREWRAWISIPAVAVIAAAAAALTMHSAAPAITAGLLAAALAAAIRAFAGPDGASAVAAIAGAALGALGWLALGASVRGGIAGASAMFAICELVRPRDGDASPWPAVGAGVLAAVLSPAYAPLAAVASARAFATWRARPRWAVLVPLAGGLIALAAVLAAFGTVAALERTWAAHAARGISRANALAALAAAGAFEGPLAATAALAGIAHCATRGRYAASAALGVAAFAGLDAIASPSPTAAVPIAAALFAGIAVGRLAALIHVPVGRAFAGAAAGFVLVAVPAWALAAH